MEDLHAFSTWPRKSVCPRCGAEALQFKADVTRFANLADEERLPEVPM